MQTGNPRSDTGSVCCGRIVNCPPKNSIEFFVYVLYVIEGLHRWFIRIARLLHPPRIRALEGGGRGRWHGRYPDGRRQTPPINIADPRIDCALEILVSCDV